MSKVIVMNSVTLDGVMQGPGRPDEDTRDGFTLGGWAVPGSDELMVTKMGERMGEEQAFLFGRRTYEDLLASWNAHGRPVQGCAEQYPEVRRLDERGNETGVAELDAPARRRPGRGGRAEADIERQPRGHGQRGADRPR